MSKPRLRSKAAQTALLRVSLLAAGFALAGAGGVASERESPPVLAAEWPVPRLSEGLLARESWRPVPTIADRERWAALPARLREALVRRGEKALAEALPPLPATLFLEYARLGDRRRFEEPFFDRRDRLHALVLAEAIENRGRFLDAVLDTLWAIFEESSWCVPAHQGAQKAGVGLPDTAEPIVDLFAAQTAHSLAWTDYLLGDRLDPRLVRARLSREVDARVLRPYLAREDFGWMGFQERADGRRPNNWNPWINSNVLASTLLLEGSTPRRVELVHKVLRSLDRFLGPHPKDGSCDEGPAYWNRAGGSLFESLELLHSATAGKADFFADPVIREIGRFIYRARIAGDWYVNIGDAPARVGIDRGLVFRFGTRIGDPLLAALGASGASEDDFGHGERSLGRMLLDIFGWKALAEQRAAPAPLLRDVWLPSEDLQLMAARDREGTSEGLYVAAWGGHNGQSHNHNDVGNAIVYVDGEPVIVDVGSVTYTAATFSARRYEIWAMQSAYHNLPTVNGVLQSARRAAAARNVAYSRSPAAAQLRMELAAAYPAEAGIASWNRTIRLDRGRQVTLSDSFRLARPTRDVVLSLMTPCDVSEERPGILRLERDRSQGAGRLVAFARFDARAVAAKIERIELEDDRLAKTWGPRMSRIQLTARDPVQSATYTLTVSKGAP